MAQTNYTPISLYYSTTASAAPTSGNLVNGELAINITDGKLYFKNNSGTVTLLASAAGASGDVVGPSSATDNALVRFDTTTGKLVQNSVGILSDAGILTGLTGLTSSGNITLSSLTSGRVPYASTGGLLVDSANMTFNGTTLTVAGLSNTGNTILGDASADTVTINGTITSNLIFTDNTYDIGASGATRPRNLYLAGTATIGSTVTLSGGTANGVMYLNASKNITTGTALAYDGTALTIGSVSGQLNMYYPGIAAGSGNPIYFSSDSGGTNSTYASFSAVLESGTRKGKLYFQTSNGSTPVVRWNIDSYGALGSGQTNSAWGGTTVPIQMGAAGAIYGNTAANYMNIGSNLYFDGTSNKRIVADYATLYSQLDGNHDWFVGGTGAAGSAITLYQTMRLATTGHLLLSGGSLNDVSLFTLTGNNSITSLGYTTLTQRFDTANYDAIRFQNASGSQDYVRIGYDLSAGAGSSGIARIEALGAASYVSLIANNIAGLTSNYEGNVGVRTTAYAWGTSNIGFDIGAYGGLGQITSVSSTVLTQNLYHTGSGFVAKNTGVGSYYQQYAGGHLWYYTPSVSGGASASPSLQMFLSTSGQLILGATATANGATFATAAPPNSTIGTQAAFISGAKGAYAGGASLPTGQLMVYDTTTNTAGSGGAISFAADCGSGQYTWLAAIDGRRDSATAGNYGGSLNFYVRPVGSYNNGPNETITSGGVHQFLNGSGTLLGQINQDSGFIAIGIGDSGLMFLNTGQLRIIPRKPGTPGSASDNAIDLGDGGSRFRTIYAGTGTINTSDANEKQDFANITEAERRAAVAVKALFKSFRFKDAVAEKGDAARIHFGVVAQEVRSAFEAEGLDAHRYGLFCSDTWYEVNGNRYMDAREVTSADAGAVERTRLGVRYDELLSFVICAI